MAVDAEKWISFVRQYGPHIVTHKSPMRYAFNTIAIFSENTDELGSH